MAAPERKTMSPTGNSRTRSADARGRGGFTLIELILVMAVLAIVLAIIAPSLGNFFRGRTLDSEARRFVSLTRYAESRAVSEGSPMLLWMRHRCLTPSWVARREIASSSGRLSMV